MNVSKESLDKMEKSKILQLCQKTFRELSLKMLLKYSKNFQFLINLEYKFFFSRIKHKLQ